MKRKVLGSLFVLGVLLAVVGVRTRPKDERASQPTSPLPSAKTVSPRAMASYRVQEEGVVGGIDYRGAEYTVRVAESGVRYGADDFTVHFGAPRVEQGDLSLECGRGTFSRPAFGEGQIDRGAVIEKYVFENHRAEQLFVLPQAVGTGALRVRIPVQTDLTGPVVAHSATEAKFNEMQFVKGGLAFCDAAGATKLAYHSAIVKDSDQRELALAPRFENGQIVLEVPESFMSAAVYPVVIDPWLELGGSASGGGVTNNSSVSDRPAVAITGAGLVFLAWADSSAAPTSVATNTEIYVRIWNGFDFTDLGNSSKNRGISNNDGRSTFPSIVIEGGNGKPVVAWQDDTGGFLHIQLRQWTGTSWAEVGGSGRPLGISASFGPAQHPSVGLVNVLIPGNGVTTFDKFVNEPVVAWEEITSTSEIYASFFYPGNEFGVPSGWYSLAGDGTGIDPTKRYPLNPVSANTPTGASEYPSLVVTGSNDIAVAWQDSDGGNYDIYVAAWVNGGAISVGIDPINGGYEIEPMASGGTGGLGWTPVGAGSNSGGGISGTAGFSLYPSLAADGDNLTCAWQEAVAGKYQVYLKRDSGSGFAAIDSSASGNGLSQSVGNATDPSVDVNGGYIGVAWSDDSSGSSEIYVRRFATSGGVHWEQVGFQGSAFPAINTDSVAPINGISNTSTLSMTPRIRMDAFGNPTVVWADGAGGRFDVFMKQFAPNGPGTTSGSSFLVGLKQSEDAAGTINISVGGTTGVTTVFFSSPVFTETLVPVATEIILQVEIVPVGDTFNGSPTVSSAPVTIPGGSSVGATNAVVGYTGQPNFAYKWQARTIDQKGRRSPWFQFPTGNGASYRISTGGVGGGGGGGGGGSPTVFTKSKSKCGLLGLEVLLALGAVRLLRRRRKV